jgi:hypothetical protein
MIALTKRVYKCIVNITDLCEKRLHICIYILQNFSRPLLSNHVLGLSNLCKTKALKKKESLCNELRNFHFGLNLRLALAQAGS